MSNFIPKEELLTRRKNLQNLLTENEVLVILSNPVIQRNTDADYKFRQDSNFWYFTGLDEPDSILILTKEKTIIFCREKDELNETWTGYIPSFEEVKEITLVDEVYKFSDFLLKLETILKNQKTLYFDFDLENYVLLRKQIIKLSEDEKVNLKKANILTSKLRVIKSKWEIEQMRKASKFNSSIHNFIKQNIEFFPYLEGENRLFEFQIEAEILRAYNWQGLDWSYWPVVAGGNNATTLHYVKNNQALNKSDLILIDAGCEYNYYASDITRTFPVGGKMSAVQKEIYDLGLNANLEVIDYAKKFKTEKIDLRDLFNKGRDILIQGLIDLQVFTESFEEVLEKELWKKYIMGAGHFLGLDVHDPGYEFLPDGKVIRPELETGMAFTIEPGVYFNVQRFPDSPYAGIGVRIEDDFVITEKGLENLSEGASK